MSRPVTAERLERCWETVRDRLLAERTDAGHWVGELSTSALSTATAVMTLEQIRRQNPPHAPSYDLPGLIAGGLRWLAEHQNTDGGWGDTVQSLSNISTTMLVHAVFHATHTSEQYASQVRAAKRYIDEAGGVPAVVRRYGKDKTFSVPILTHCALAGLVDWKQITQLPFELAWLPPQFYAAVKLPVVSYALPALIAIGQVRFHHVKSWNPALNQLRRAAIAPTLRRLESIQPGNGGFLEAAPLTSFVTMSLAGMGRADHPVAVKGLQFLVDSVRPDGSWPIDTNLATWVTTLSINALKTDLPDDSRSALRDWLLNQQYRQVHPYTNAAPGGWAWTNLPGGVPDADDTPGAMLALLQLSAGQELTPEDRDGLQAGVQWLLDLQNRDGGWPTFCRGWGTLPFDRSAADITAHALRALFRWDQDKETRRRGDKEKTLSRDVEASGLRELSEPGNVGGPRLQQAIRRGFLYLEKVQRDDGSWLPLWFGNQFADDDINPVYGTARVLMAYRDIEPLWLDTVAVDRALRWLKSVQNADGGWGGDRGISSSVEETSLAVEILACAEPHAAETGRGIAWLCEQVERDTFAAPTPIGFYFARLWYFERLYPLIFVASALRTVRERHTSVQSVSLSETAAKK